MRIRYTRLVATFGMLVLISLLVGTAAARVTNSPAPTPGEIVDFRMSDSPDGPAMEEFPTGTKVVYVILEYADCEGDQIKIVVYDPRGFLLLNLPMTLTGSGRESIPVTYSIQKIFLPLVVKNASATAMSRPQSSLVTRGRDGGGGEPPPFPPAWYITNLYRGEFLSKSVWWKVQ